LCWHRQEDKLGALLHLVTEVIPGGQPTIVFASTRHHVELVAQVLRADGVASAHVYGTMDQVTFDAYCREINAHASEHTLSASCSCIGMGGRASAACQSLHWVLFDCS